jgi:hypothetical protein
VNDDRQLIIHYNYSAKLSMSFPVRVKNSPGGWCGSGHLCRHGQPGGTYHQQRDEDLRRSQRSDTIKGRAEASAKEIAKVLKLRFEQHGGSIIKHAQADQHFYPPDKKRN